MPTRSPALQRFLDAAQDAFVAHAVDDISRTSIAACFDALKTVEPQPDRPGGRLPVCDEWLEVAVRPEALPPALRPLAQAFLALEPDLRWQRRNGPIPKASADFEDGHANAVMVGPGGMEPRRDVWLGASLVAPGVRYPDHDHPPEETYLVLTPGDFSQDNGPWFSPGVGGSFHNVPGILHAMRAGPEPLFALWLLRAGDA